MVGSGRGDVLAVAWISYCMGFHAKKIAGMNVFGVPSLTLRFSIGILAWYGDSGVGMFRHSDVRQVFLKHCTDAGYRGCCT